MAVDRSDPIAIVGIGCRFPGGVKDVDTFWQLLEAGADAIGDVPSDRWDLTSFYDADTAAPARMFVRQGGFLDRTVDTFDAGFFGMSPREAAALDPQQRLLLEVTWEALENAGIPPSSTAATEVGVYVGGFTFDAATLQLAETNQHLVSSSTPTGVSMTMLAARLSYVFDWRGPSLTIDTACSSSLVALHHACTALARGECDMAVAGGVNVMVNPVTTVLMSKGQFLSPDARCKSFDHRANGYARGEGAGVLLLKPLSAAMRDGDLVHAVIRGTAVNQDGHTLGITVPSVAAQQSLIRRACEVGGVEPESVGYFEAHGTGTAVGDPIEATAIGEVLGNSERTHWIGSVKSNFGHTEAAAGVAGVIKAALCLSHGSIPRNLHFEQPNPRIPFDRLPLRVPTEMVPFPVMDGPRRAGVNSFGFGGTNAHAILEEWTAPRPVQPEDERERPQLLPLSARSPQALRALTESFATWLEQPGAPAFGQVCRAAALERDHHRCRAFVVASSPAAAAKELRALEVEAVAATRNAVAFVYTGMGPQWWGMGRELLDDEPVFARVVDECDEVLARFGLSMRDELRRGEATSRLTSTVYAQVANFVVQAGLTALWREWGISPAMIVGHSVGEVAAAHAAGVYSLEDALTISYHRARLQARLAGHGAMIAVDVPAAEVVPLLAEGVSVAAVNSACATTLAGDAEAIEITARRLTEAGASVKHLQVEVAYHSPQMEEIHEPLVSALTTIQPRTARIPLFSTVTGDQVDGTELDADYWWRNVRQPVLFADALRRLLTRSPGAVLEIGPHPVLASAIDEALSSRTDTVVRLASLRREVPQRQHLLATLGRLYVTGFDPQWTRVQPEPRTYLNLPQYPWQRDRHWLESAASRTRRLGTAGPLLGGRAVVSVTPVREVELSGSAFPYLADHRIGDSVVFPGSGYLEAALAAFAEDEPCELQDVVFHRPLVLTPPAVTVLRAGYDPARRLLTLHSRGQEDDAEWTLHAELHRAYLPKVTAPPPLPVDVSWTREVPAVEHDDVYAMLSGTGLNYGRAFRAVQRLWVRHETREIHAELRLDTTDQDGHRLHPVVLDAALQAVIAGAHLIGADGAGSGTYVPASIDALRFFRSPGTRLWVSGQGRNSSAEGQIECDLTLVTDGGEIVAEVRGLRARRLAEADEDRPSLRYEHLWRPEPIDVAAELEGRWIVVGTPVAGAHLVQGIEALGGEVLHVEREDDRWPEHVAAAADGCRAVIYLDEVAAEFQSACAPAAPLVQLVQALPSGSGSLVVVTTGAQSVSADDPTTAPAAAALWGLGRVVAAERAELRCRLVDLAPAAAWSEEKAAEALLAELAQDNLDEVALRHHGRYVRQLSPVGERSAIDHVTVTTDATAVRLAPPRRAGSGLGFVAATRTPPGPGQVELAVSHVGLNFKDVLKQTGLISPNALKGSHSGDTLGLECSGTVIEVGAGVSGLRAGDEVFAHSRDLFASHVTLDAVRVVKKPSNLSAAEAASLLPVVTAHASLVRLAGVQPGDRVLVHSAGGGVGLAAARIATWLGAEVLLTAGSEHRRDFLRQQGFTHVTDSRSASFADDVLEWTAGAGVDVIINSLPGDMIQHSLRVLNTFGRFVELGKPGAVADHAVRLASAQRALSFHSFDYDQMMALRPEEVQECMRAVADLYERHAIAPLPVTEVSADEADRAFRTMASPEHHGKVVIRMVGEQITLPASSLPDVPVRPGATYLVTGGLGGLGLSVARWLADHGASHLVLASRRGVTTEEAARTVAELTSRGVDVRIERADVGDADQVSSLFALATSELPLIRGVVHCAADFDDAVLADVDASRLVRATRPKADGAWHLHQETAGGDLDFFVLFSSVAAQLGAAGAGAYATANEFLNGLARYRRARGLPATSIGWGMVDDVGVAVSRGGYVGDVLRRTGHAGMAPARLLRELETLLRTNPTEVSVADIDWPRWARANPQLAALPKFRGLVPADGADGAADDAVAVRLRDASAAERVTMLPDLVAPLLQRVTGLDDEQVRAEVVDIDSLTAVELRVLLQKQLGVAVPSVRLQRGLTVDALSALLADELDQVRSGPAVSLTVHEITSTDGLVVYGHLSVPSGPGPHPAVVVCTAGEGGALNAEGEYAHIGAHAPLNAAGFAVLTVDQRGAPGHGPEFRALAEMGDRDVDDVIATARYLEGLPDIDGDRISVLGTSRGAYTALLALARAPRRWHRAALLMGLYDPDQLVAAELAEPGSLLPARPELAASDVEAHFAVPDRRPMELLDRITAPLLVVHGDADRVVPVEQAHALAAHTAAAGRPAQLLVQPGLAHDSDHEDPVWSGIWPDVVGFLLEETR
ncbi:SDR family NAD(P)-dependent oxidoreductase [Lentzea sp. NPDC004782]|uniref:SDR family NAD(P)-dependent oxidoreductase n=1 Tax=Lentzea sp. NPDC004782 TaxID=3154458 RepID=UPI0033A34064